MRCASAGLAARDTQYAPKCSPEAWGTQSSQHQRVVVRTQHIRMSKPGARESQRRNSPMIAPANQESFGEQKHLSIRRHQKLQAHHSGVHPMLAVLVDVMGLASRNASQPRKLLSLGKAWMGAQRHVK